MYEEALVSRGFSEDASKLMAASVRPQSSGKNYNYLVKVYMSWCEEQVPRVDPFTAPVQDVANFLAFAHSSRDLGQSAVASFRSAISKVHVGFQSGPVGKDPAISNLIKGVGNSNPDRKARKPRYQATWDMSGVLEALAPLHPPQSLKMGELAMKTLALVAMSTISRASTMIIMTRKFSYTVNEIEGGEPQLFVEFLPGAQEKSNSRKGVHIAPLTEEESLNPVLYLLEYKKRTDREGLEELSPLWTSTRKPFRPVKSVTLATWLRKAMEKGGVDTSTFKAFFNFDFVFPVRM